MDSALSENLKLMTQSRDEMKAHAFRLSGELEAARATIAEAAQRIAALELQRDALEAERDELKTYVTRLSAVADQQEVHAWRRPELLTNPAGHFYSPIVDPASVFVAQALSAPLPLAAIDLDSARMQLEFDKLASWYGEMPFQPHKSQGLRYYFENPAFSYTDAFVLYAYLRSLKPRRIVEIGCGYSTCALFDTADRFLDPPPQISCFDPYPDVAIRLTEDDDHLRRSIQAIPLQQIPSNVFASLEPNDILFIDSSHVAKTGSDVVDYMFRALPLIRPGVYIHVHDIGYPFEYPHEWVVAENRSWNEIYLLRAFLMYNAAFEIVFWNSYFVSQFPEKVRAQTPDCLKNGGGSIWLRRR